MDRMVDSAINLLNTAGPVFGVHAWGAFVQSSMLVAVLLVLDVLLRKRVRAVVRYSVWMLVFVKLLLPPTLSLPTGIGYYWPRRTVALQESPASAAGETATAATEGVRPRTVSTATRAPDVIGILGASTPPDRTPPVPASSVSFRPAITWYAWVFLGWLVGVLALCIYLIRRFQYVRKLVRESTPAVGELQEMLAECAAKLGLRRCPPLCLSAEAPGPVVCRLWRPVVLVPTTLADKVSEDHLRTVLAHELVHIKRADLWVNFVQTLLLVAYFYHPLLWVANAIVRRLREQAVDETVLVALEAEAKSYSTTLIDLAEMTFGRPVLGLRLIGIAESRNALEGRIRHMMAQPKPESARVGALGLLATVAIAAVLLPMARARRQPTADAVETYEMFVATLADGGTVELVGLCRNPAIRGQQWWRPDGTIIDEPENERWPDTSWQYPAFGYLLRFSTGQDVSYRNSTRVGHLFFVLGAVGVDGQAVVSGGENTPMAESLPDRVDIHVDVAAGDWETHAGSGRRRDADSLYPEYTPLPNRKVIVLSGLRPNQKKDGPEALIEVTTTETDVNIQLECTTSDGRIHASLPLQLSPFDGLIQYAFGFPVLIQDIERIVVKYRPYHRVTFRNVSLRPGKRTEVQVEAMVPSGAELAPGLPDYVDPEARVESATRLSDLGRALLIYANDHEGRLPDELLGVLDYDRAGFSWLYSNVAYLGQGMTVRDRPERPVAYDRTLIQSGSGTNVLYLNLRVAFEEPDELEKLGIKPVPKPAEVLQQEAAVQARVAVLSNLKNLALAAHLYASDNDGVFPDDLEALAPYLSHEKELRTWARANVDYVGKGAKATGGSQGAQKPLAWCRLPNGPSDELGVAFQDGHAEIVSGDRLKTLAIKPAVESQEGSYENSSEYTGHLAKALMDYGYAHGDALPDVLEGLRGLVTDEDFQWFVRNVEYRGAGKTVNNPFDIVVAYDKTMLDKTGSTLALYFWRGAVITKLRSRDELRIEIDCERASKQDIEARVESRTRLANLGRALLVYANEHGGKLPDELSGVRSYDRAGFPWLSCNVGYLGRGTTTQDRPERPIAYDRTLLLKGYGTNVLCLNSEVTFLNPLRLLPLGIKAEPSAGDGAASDTEIYARGTVLGNLKLFEIVAGNYAAENNLAYANDLVELKSDLMRYGESLWPWARDNVEYLGKGAKLTDAPPGYKPMAYCRPASDAAEEVAVAFWDRRVEYAKIADLREIGVEIRTQEDN